MLFASLVENFRVVVLGTEDPARDNHFLMINGLVKHVKVEPVEPGDQGRIEPPLVRQVQRLRREGFHFEFVVVPDPDVARELYEIGVPVLLYLHPTFTGRAFRPDTVEGLTPWNELAAEVEFQITAKAERQVSE
jgi:hypothetical protein